MARGNVSENGPKKMIEWLRPLNGETYAAL